VVDLENASEHPQIHLSSTFELSGIDAERSLEDVDPDAGEFLYSRLSNPARHAVESQLARLEDGEEAYAFGSGTAAIATAALAVLEPGDHLVAVDDGTAMVWMETPPKPSSSTSRSGSAHSSRRSTAICSRAG